MLERAKEIIAEIAEKTDSIILMHSLSGKDSIALLDLLHPYFKRIVCVYMYVVPNLEHIEVYRRWAQATYPKAEFVQVPHYGLYSWIKPAAAAASDLLYPIVGDQFVRTFAA